MIDFASWTDSPFFQDMGDQKASMKATFSDIAVEIINCFSPQVSEKFYQTTSGASVFEVADIESPFTAAISRGLTPDRVWENANKIAYEKDLEDIDARGLLVRLLAVN